MPAETITILISTYQLDQRKVFMTDKQRNGA